MSEELETRIEIRAIAHGQPRAYADRQDIYEVTVWNRRYLRKSLPSGAYTRLERCWHPKMLEQIALGAVRAPSGRQAGAQHAFDSFTDYVHHVDRDGREYTAAPNRSKTGTVRIRIVHPYTD